MLTRFSFFVAMLAFGLVACEGPAGPMGPVGPRGDHRELNRTARPKRNRRVYLDRVETYG